MHLIKKCSLEGLSEIGIVKMGNRAPETIIRESAFGKEAVDMRVPV